MTAPIRTESLLSEPLPLPCGAVLPNRIAKSAMSERLGHAGAPTDALVTLYERWARGGAGLFITGNVMVDDHHGEPGNVTADPAHLDAFRAWAAAAPDTWVQLNHPGRQAPVTMVKQPVAPSAIRLEVPGFATPRALEGHEVDAMVGKFADAAALMKEAGFAGVQVHGAHGYLVSQFLSPRSNQRTDAWGTDRKRFLLAVVDAIRERVGPDYPIGVKLNSADFQRGGFTETESMEVVQALVGRIDLLEVSGGSYEKAAMFSEKASSKAREAFFIDYCDKVRAITGDALPVLLTGGFRSRAAMEGALAGGAVDMVGMARPLAVEPDLPSRLLEGAEGAVPVTVHTGIADLDALLTGAWYQVQIERMARGKAPDPGLWRIRALLWYFRDHLRGKR